MDKIYLYYWTLLCLEWLHILEVWWVMCTINRSAGPWICAYTTHPWGGVRLIQRTHNTFRHTANILTKMPIRKLKNRKSQNDDIEQFYLNLILIIWNIWSFIIKRKNLLGVNDRQLMGKRDPQRKGVCRSDPLDFYVFYGEINSRKLTNLFQLFGKKESFKKEYLWPMRATFFPTQIMLPSI